MVERVLGKDEVTGSIPVPGSMLWRVRMSGGNSGVESLPSKQMVAGSNPVPRSIEMSGGSDGPEIIRRGKALFHLERGNGRTVLMRG